jgi:hypothetical protein
VAPRCEPLVKEVRKVRAARLDAAEVVELKY